MSRLIALFVLAMLAACEPPYAWPEMDAARARREEEHERRLAARGGRPVVPDGEEALASARLTYPACPSPRFVEWTSSTAAELDVCGVRRIYHWSSDGGPLEAHATAVIEQPITEETDPSLVRVIEEIRRLHWCPGARVRIVTGSVDGSISLEICNTPYRVARRDGVYVRVPLGG